MIRFRNDPFWGVHTYPRSTRTWIDPRKRVSTWKSWPLCSTCTLTETDSPRTQKNNNNSNNNNNKSHFFCLFPLFASVALLYCFTSLCPEEGVYVVCLSWRKVIKERLQRQKEKQTKDEAKWNKHKRPESRPGRRRGTVASEDNSNHPRFVFEGNSPRNYKKRAATGFGKETAHDRDH